MDTQNQQLNSISYTWDIFCKVIDNYGDIATSWRLAKTLTKDFNQKIRLIVDELSALQALVPATQLNLDQQTLENIEIYLWTEDLNLPPTNPPTQLVIETFGCYLPKNYQAQLLKNPPKAWLNLEYFSVENWVADFHLLPSTQAGGLVKHFFFPSLLPNTGGLNFENDYFARQKKFYSQTIPTPLPLEKSPEKMLKISMFSYENPALNSLIEVWQKEKTHFQIPNSKSLDKLVIKDELIQQKTLNLKKLKVELLDFLPQAKYDQLLWQQDLNFVRGEESLARALISGKPFVWHIYPTEDQAHFAKLEALLNLYTQGLDKKAAQAWCEFNLAWNQAHPPTQPATWQELWHNLKVHLTQLEKHAQLWQEKIQQQGSLSANLLKFINGL